MSAAVPCNGCKACCKKELIVLKPERGDDHRTYDVQLIEDPFSGRMVHALKHQANGDCIYLGMHGCTIHGRAPAICREFDCRRWYVNAHHLMKKHPINKEMVTAARARLHTLRIEDEGSGHG